MLLQHEGNMPNLHAQTTAENVDFSNSEKTVCTLDGAKPATEQQTETPAEPSNMTEQPAPPDGMCCCLIKPAPKSEAPAEPN